MDDVYNISILSDTEDILEYGDIANDPFGILDVRSLKIDGDFSKVFSMIDMDNLENETSDFNEDYWEGIIGGQDFILMTPELKSFYLRFAWWVCREIIYSPEGTTYLNIADLLKDGSDYNIKTYVYNTGNYFKLAVMLSSGAQFIIKFKDNTVLL